jgi:hypothetical protein
MDAWFSKINVNQNIVSGSLDIWLTPKDKKSYLAEVSGTGPVWVNSIVVYNGRDGGTYFDKDKLPASYNFLTGSDDTRWAGFLASPARVDLYEGATLIKSISEACIPRLAKDKFGYLTPYQAPNNVRSLIVNGIVYSVGIITDWIMDITGTVIVWQVATGVHTRELHTLGGKVSLYQDEYPVAAFLLGTEPWIVTGTGDKGFLVRPVLGYVGYRIGADLYYPDARVIDGRLLVVGSDSRGQPLFDNWIDFSEERIDLRFLDPVVPPVTEPPPIEPPVPPIEPPIVKPPIEPLPPVETFPVIKELEFMEPEIVSLVAFDHFARVDGDRLVFDQDTESEETDFEWSQPDNLFAFKRGEKYVSVDSTIHSSDPRNQYSLTDVRGGYESFFCGTPEGESFPVAFVIYRVGSGANITEQFISIPITVKRKK